MGEEEEGGEAWDSGFLGDLQQDIGGVVGPSQPAQGVVARNHGGGGGGSGNSGGGGDGVGFAGGGRGPAKAPANYPGGDAAFRKLPKDQRKQLKAAAAISAPTKNRGRPPKVKQLRNLIADLRKATEKQRVLRRPRRPGGAGGRRAQGASIRLGRTINKPRHFALIDSD